MRKILLIITALALIPMNISSAAARQQSIDKDLFQTFEGIDRRSDDHEERVNNLGVKRDGILKSFKAKHKELLQLPETDSNAEERQRRHTLQAELNKLATQHLKVSYQMVFSAEEVISANLNDIAKLTERLKNSPTSRAKILKLQRQIKRNIKTGRMMRKNLQSMAMWSENDPVMKEKFKDLNRVMHSLDRRITVSKSMFPKSGSDEQNGFSSRRIAALNKSTKMLLDKLAGVRSEKERLAILKGRLEHNVDLFRLRRTLDIARRAAPQLKVPGFGSEADGPEKETVSNIIEDLSSDIMKNNKLDEDDLDASVEFEKDGTGGKLKSGEFKNF